MLCDFENFQVFPLLVCFVGCACRSVNQSSTKLSVRLVEWLSFEENKVCIIVWHNRTDITSSRCAHCALCTDEKSKELSLTSFLQSQAILPI